jgi:hypothetical protein
VADVAAPEVEEPATMGATVDARVPGEEKEKRRSAGTTRHASRRVRHTWRWRVRRGGGSRGGGERKGGRAVISLLIPYGKLPKGLDYLIMDYKTGYIYI